MGYPNTGTAWSIPYEFYASKSGLKPKTGYDISTHKLFFWRSGSNLVPAYGYTDDEHRVAFYQANSGLTPVTSFSLTDHFLAYYDKLDLPSNWEAAIIKEEVNMAIALQGTIAALNDTVFGDTDALDYQSVTVSIAGTFVGTITFQVSNDAVNWYSKTIVTANGSAVTTTTAPGIFAVDIGARYFRAIATAWTSGSATLIANYSRGSQSFGLATQNVSGTVTANLGTGGTGGTSLGKAEDAAHASGDTGVAIWGVRVPTTPAAQTSATGDYGSLAVNAEGKLVVSVGAADELGWQSNPVTLTSTTSTALKAAAAAGIRNYMTDLTIINTSATGVRVDILDGATVIRSYWAAPTSNIVQTFDMALKSTAATALNVQLSAAVTDVRVSANGYLGV